jgi:hypothetical protein
MRVSELLAAYRDESRYDRRWFGKLEAVEEFARA